jgi:hypothetical protein
MVQVYDRPLLRSSARAEGASEPMFDRYATDYERPDASVRVTVRALVTQHNRHLISLSDGVLH